MMKEEKEKNITININKLVGKIKMDKCLFDNINEIKDEINEKLIKSINKIKKIK